IEVLPILYAKDLVMKQGTSDQFRAQLYDGQGNPYAGQNITFNIHGIFYQRTTDADGWATLNIKLSAAANTYIITSMYNDCVISNKIVIEPA
uniref:Ig-like domain-containing protein n=3 Tax=uncultured Methanobrevibacter sp. TaxID=253161 RepID=UPI0025D63417